MVRGSRWGDPTGVSATVDPAQPITVRHGTGTVGTVRSGAAAGPVGGGACPGLVIGLAGRAGDDAAMHAHSAQRSPSFPVLSTVGGVLAGTILVVTGVLLAWVAFATPLVARVAGNGGFGSSPGFGPVVVLAIAVTLIVLCLGVGGARLATVLAGVRPAVPRSGRPGLPGNVVTALRVDVGDGRPIPEVIVGQFGAAVIRELPAADLTRHHGPNWEARTEHGWIRIENPLDRAGRDAERVRRWFAHDGHDFVIRVYAVVIAPDTSLPRTRTCAVITADQLPAWLASLPNQRSLTAGRLARLGELLRAAA